MFDIIKINMDAIMKLEYEYMGEMVMVYTIKNNCCDMYYVTECFVGPGNQGHVIAGPYPRQTLAEVAGEEYVKSITGQL